MYEIESCAPSGRLLDLLGLGVDPLTSPLTYPGRPPREPATLLLDRSLLRVRPADAAPTGPPGSTGTGDPDRSPGPDRSRGPAGTGGPTGSEALDDLLVREGAAPMSARHAVLAVGSNASPAQLHRKLILAGVRPVVPITSVTVRGVVVGVSAHVSRAGYLPATPVMAAGSVSDLFVTWFDDAQLAAMDATEPNYRRVPVPTGHPVRLPGGAEIAGCGFYVSRRGCLLHSGGRPRLLVDQSALITTLLGEVPGLADLAGPSPARWLTRTQEASVRDRIRGLFRQQGLVGHEAACRAGIPAQPPRVVSDRD